VSYKRERGGDGKRGNARGGRLPLKGPQKRRVTYSVQEKLILEQGLALCAGISRRKNERLCLERLLGKKMSWCI
jgi:hypothetical protein